MCLLLKLQQNEALAADNVALRQENNRLIDETHRWSQAVRQLEAERAARPAGRWARATERRPAIMADSGWSAEVLAFVTSAPGSDRPTVVLARCDRSGIWHGKNFANGPAFRIYPLYWQPIDVPALPCFLPKVPAGSEYANIGQF